MTQIILYGGITGGALFLGAVTGLIFKLSQRTIAGIIAFGSGVLICALTFGLMTEAFEMGGFDAVIIGFLLGGLAFIGIDYLLHLGGGRSHRRKHFSLANDQSNGSVITLGTILDAIPESIALGVAVFNGLGTGLLMLVAIALNNFPESISSISGLRKQKYSNRKILILWLIVSLATALITILSYQFLREVNLNTLGMLEAFSAGAILAMLADTMMPEAFEEGGFAIGLLTVLGFLTAFVISRL